jgi:hypothetical protein
LWVAATMVARQPGGLVLSALYVACMNLKTLALFVPQQANAVSVAYLSRYRASIPTEYRAALTWNLLAISVATVSSALLIAVLAPYVLLLYGDEFQTGASFLQVLMAAAVAEAVAYGLTQHFSARGAMWTVFFSASLPRDLIVVLAASVYLSTHGLEAIGYAFLVSWVVYSAGLSIALVSSRRRIGNGDRA